MFVHSGKTLFVQGMSFLPWMTFARIVDRYNGDLLVRTLRCTEHYRAMAFAQLTGRFGRRANQAALPHPPFPRSVLDKEGGLTTNGIHLNLPPSDRPAHPGHLTSAMMTVISNANHSAPYRTCRR